MLDSSTKQSLEYLNGINRNTEEKVEVIKNAVERNRLPKGADSIFKIVELGVGGGESLKELVRSVKRDGVKIVGVDVIPSLVKTMADLLGIEGVVASANRLPLANNSVSAINASAILHEVSSYGVDTKGQQIYGLEAIRDTLRELKRVLLPGGIVACRDVLAPQSDPHALKTARYYPPSWRMFAEFFLPDFIKSQPAFYQKDRVEQKVFDDAYVLDAPVGIHRELQRHYLMFRDYIRNVEAEEFGIKIIKTYWLDQSKGLKFMIFSVKRKYDNKVNLEHFEKRRSLFFGKVYKGTSDYVDQLYDELTQFKFEEMARGTPEGAKFAGLINMWKEREGHEHYTYDNFGGILSMLAEIKEDGYVLFPEKPEDLEISPRDYYNAYLKRVIDAPEFDGKQIFTLKKMSVQEARTALSKLESSPLLTSAVLEKITKELA